MRTLFQEITVIIQFKRLLKVTGSILFINDVFNGKLFNMCSIYYFEVGKNLKK